MSELITAQNLELVIKKNHEIKEEVLAQAIRLQTNPSIMKVASAPQLALLILQGFGLIQMPIEDKYWSGAIFVKDDMDCIYMNEHIVNLLLEVRGNIRTDKQNMLETINTYLQLPKQEQELFNLGRRLNIMFFLADLNNRAKRKQTEEGLRKIKTQNPDLDLAFVCNYVRQTQI